MKRTLLATAVAALIAAPAFAAVESFNFDVSFNPAALDAPVTAAAEYESITRQVTERCAAEHNSASFSGVYSDYATRFCTRRTMDRAVRQIGHPQLSEIHAERRNTQ